MLSDIILRLDGSDFISPRVSPVEDIFLFKAGFEHATRKTSEIKRD